MAYIGFVAPDTFTGAFIKDEFTVNANPNEAGPYTLSQAVPGGQEENIMVVLGGVIQEPGVAYTIGGSGGNLEKEITFIGTPLAGTDFYIIHRGVGTMILTPAAGTVGNAQLSQNLREFTNDKFSGTGAQLAFTLSSEQFTNSVIVIVGGVFQHPVDSYSVSGTTLTFTEAPPTDTDNILVIHMGFVTNTKKVILADDSISEAKLDTALIAKVSGGNAQVQGTERDTDFSTVSITPVDLITVSITTTKTSNIRVMGSISGSAANGWGWQVLRDAVELVGVAGQAGNIPAGTSGNGFNHREEAVPAGTYTYKLQVRTDDAGNAFACNPVTLGKGNNSATLIVIEEN